MLFTLSVAARLLLIGAPCIAVAAVAAASLYYAYSVPEAHDLTTGGRDNDNDSRRRRVVPPSTSPSNEQPHHTFLRRRRQVAPTPEEDPDRSINPPTPEEDPDRSSNLPTPEEDPDRSINPPTPEEVDPDRSSNLPTPEEDPDRSINPPTPEEVDPDRSINPPTPEEEDPDRSSNLPTPDCSSSVSASPDGDVMNINQAVHVAVDDDYLCREEAREVLALMSELGIRSNVDDGGRREQQQHLPEWAVLLMNWLWDHRLELLAGDAVIETPSYIRNRQIFRRLLRNLSRLLRNRLRS